MSDSIPFELKEHLLPFIEDCKRYYSYAKMFESLKVGDGLFGGFGKNRTDIFGVVKNVNNTKEVIYILIEFFETKKPKQAFNKTTIAIPKKYTPHWTTIGNAPYYLNEFEKINNFENYKLVYSYE